MGTNGWPCAISGKNINIGEALRTHVSDQLNAATGKYFDGSVTGHVTIEPEGSGYRTDCTLHLASGVTLQAEGRAQEVYASFDQTAARIESRLRRYKRKLKDRSAAQREILRERRADPLHRPQRASTRPRRRRPNTNSSRRSSPNRKSCCRSFRFRPRCWSSTCVGAPVLVFRHATTGRVNVIYRRLDGNIGWIDPTRWRQRLRVSEARFLLGAAGVPLSGRGSRRVGDCASVAAIPPAHCAFALAGAAEGALTENGPHAA